MENNTNNVAPIAPETVVPATPTPEAAPAQVQPVNPEPIQAAPTQQVASAEPVQQVTPAPVEAVPAAPAEPAPQTVTAEALQNPEVKTSGTATAEEIEIDASKSNVEVLDEYAINKDVADSKSKNKKNWTFIIMFFAVLFIAIFAFKYIIKYFGY